MPSCVMSASSAIDWLSVSQGRGHHPRPNALRPLFPFDLLLRFLSSYSIISNAINRVVARTTRPCICKCFPRGPACEPGLSSPRRSQFSAASPAVWRLRCPGESAPSNIQPQSFDRRAVIRTTGTFGYEFAGGGGADLAAMFWRSLWAHAMSQPAEAGLEQSTGPNGNCQIGPVGFYYKPLVCIWPRALSNTS